MEKNEVSKSQSKSDEELMIDFMNGSEEAFREIYDLYSRRVYSYLSKRLNQKALVEDAFQEVFLKLAKSRHSFDNACKFAPWLFSIVSHVVIDVFRRERKHQKVVESMNLNPSVETPEEQGSIDIEKLVSSLSSRDREIITLRYVNDFSFDMIAVKTGYLAANVRKIISRAIKKIRKDLYEK